MGVGSVISESLRGVTGGGQAATPSGTTPPSGGPGAMQDVMTPAEAANVLRVSEEDVLAAIEAGDLKARKLGNAYRISREALEAFLKG
jgi:excisionase family DNA binding protein